ncbi:MAG: putative LPS assembly protein LptD, partial [Bacteroidota bacterium]|nr:putative LPS assembly protein LptD [Bacteroidota bacterium]
LNGRSGSVTFSLNNNIEMKVRSDSDTTTDFKKVKLLDNLRFSTSYNIFADSMNLAPVSMSGYTTLFDSKFKINFSGTFDPYALDANGRKYNAFEVGNSGKPFRLTRFNLGIDFSFRSREKSGGSQASGSAPDRGLDMGPDEMDSQLQEEKEQVMAQTMSTMYPGYVDFNIPWNLSVRYNFNYTKPGFDSKITQTLNFNGDLKLTPKWRIGVTSGWDFEKNALSYTSMNIFRDLHCWEMRLSWIPIGYHQSYSFSINAKASILKDLKYKKQKSWYDN